jgi:hypothetical protein
VGVVNGQWWRFIAEVSPGLTLSLAGLVAAFAPFALMRRSGHGRARSAIAYLAGLAAGLAATVALAVAFEPLARSSPVVEAGLFGAFFGPFAGMLRAKWERPARRRRRPAARSPYRQAASRL